ncbi:hypothetical protein DICVIV_00620 [Dictyocaulus viviparus]|uniref:Uncharacterized protein n=1 Tax=Dictyocaulus viviparus TaxID=29172 RepID=A0A0D8YA89_DICVI|nr:hypothetical protein DICVIV_00620 [Dictyocaulus viviparus]
MRDDDKKRLHSGRISSTAWPEHIPSYTAPYREGRPTNTAVLTSPTPVQNYDFPAQQQPVTQSPVNVSQPHYSSQVPLVTPSRTDDFGSIMQYRQLQPNIIYTQEQYFSPE